MIHQPSITINSDSESAAAAVAAATQKGGSFQDDVGRQNRRALADKARAEARAGTMAATAEPIDVEVPKREPLDAIVIRLPEGMDVEIGPPRGATVATRLMMFFGARTPSIGEEQITATMICVREIDGAPVVITDVVSRDKYINMVGDNGLVILQHAYREYWPPPVIGDLVVIQKKMR